MQEDEKSELETIKKEITDLNTQLSDLEERLKNLRFDEDEENEAVEDTEEKEDKEVSEDEDTDEENNVDNNTEKRNMKKKAFSLVRSIRNIVNNAPMNDIDNAVISAGNEQARKEDINLQGKIKLQ